MIKVLLLNPTIPPRAIPILNSLSRSPGIDLTVFFYSISAKNRRWVMNNKNLKFKYKVLKSFDIGWYGKDYIPFNISLDFAGKVLSLNPDVIIVPGWTDLSSYFSALYCKLFGKKLVLRSESTVYEKSWRRTLFMPLTKFMVYCADAYTASGTRARDYLVKLGANRKKIFIGYSTIDVKRFSRDSKLSLKQKNNLKKKLGIGYKNKVIMFSGQLIVRKGIYDLLEAFKKLSKKHSDICLLIVGYGQEYKKIKKFVKDNNLQQRVVLTGFVENTKLPKYYGISDIFVLPSTEETWGMVVNEAMACGCPVIVGNKVGSSADLIVNRKNGIVFKSGDIDDLTKSLEYLLVDDKKRQLIGKEAYQFVKKFNLENIKRAILQAIKAVGK